MQLPFWAHITFWAFCLVVSNNPLSRPGDVGAIALTLPMRKLKLTETELLAQNRFGNGHAHARRRYQLKNCYRHVCVLMFQTGKQAIDCSFNLG